jgi:uncharacterized membrane protein required for colicin V production
LSLVYDLILILIVLIMVRRGFRCGLLSSLLGLIGWVVALICCVLWSTAVAQWLYHAFVEAKLVSTVASHIPADLVSAVNSGAAATQEAVSNLQSVLTTLSGVLGPLFSGIDPGSASTILNTCAQDGGTLAQVITERALEPIMVKLLTAAASIGIFLTVLLLFGILRRLTRPRRCSGTFLGNVNRFFGGVLGLGESLIVCYFYAIVLSTLSTLVGDRLTWLSPAVLEKAVLVNLFLTEA